MCSLSSVGIKYMVIILTNLCESKSRQRKAVNTWNEGCMREQKHTLIKYNTDIRMAVNIRIKGDIGKRPKRQTSGRQLVGIKYHYHWSINDRTSITVFNSLMLQGCRAVCRSWGKLEDKVIAPNTRQDRDVAKHMVLKATKNMTFWGEQKACFLIVVWSRW